MPKHKLTPGQRKALRIVGNVLDEQPDEEPNRWCPIPSLHQYFSITTVIRPRL